MWDLIREEGALRLRERRTVDEDGERKVGKREKGRRKTVKKRKKGQRERRREEKCVHL